MPENVTRRVCVVEDDDDIRSFLALVLERAGYCTESYANGLEALDAAQHSPADFYLLDRRMPGLDGTELCRRLRADPRSATSVIMLVSAETADLASAAADAGADAYLPKPFDRRELLRRIAELVATRG